jgi:taurine dioxygenase
MTLTVVPLSDRLGGEIKGVDATRPLDGATCAELRDALHRYQVIALRDQELSPEHFIALAGAFGELEPFFISAYNLPGHPEIYVLSNVRRDGRPVGRDGAGTHWHSDHTFHEAPAGVTMLHGVQVPERGGDTLFVDMYGAYDGLPDDLKARILSRRAIHRYQKKEHVYSGDRTVTPEERERIERLKAQRAREEAESGPSPTARKSNAVPDRLHPIVRTHPATGRRALYLNDEMTVGIEGLGEEEGRALLRELCERATRPERVLRYGWRRGDVVAWDNASTMHSATYTDPSLPRTMHRITIKGTVPY